MIRKRRWKESRRVGAQAIIWAMEGWYLFGLIPLYVRDIEPRGVYGYVGDQPNG